MQDILFDMEEKILEYQGIVEILACLCEAAQHSKTHQVALYELENISRKNQKSLECSIYNALEKIHNGTEKENAK